MAQTQMATVTLMKVPMCSGNWSNSVSVVGVVSYEDWTAGSPPLMSGNGTLSVTLDTGETAIPNMTSGSSQPPPLTVPSVSLYSFDASTFSYTNPGQMPGITATPSPGSYGYTLAVELRAQALSGTPRVQISNEAGGGWDTYDSPHVVVYICKDTVLRIRAENDGVYSDPKTLIYQIDQPTLIDSDKDGIPDIWEIAHGFKPLFQ